MGNESSVGTQFCSRGQLYSRRSQMASYKSDLETRVGYTTTKPRFQVQRIQNTHQQMASQQQNQEEIVEIPITGPGKWKITKEVFEIPEETQRAVKPKKKSFNVYVSCLDLEEDPIYQPKPDTEAEIVDHFKEDFTFFEGMFGNVIINKNGLILYTDITGRSHCEEYDRDEIGKIFPMGISYGGLTKSIWFKDAIARDDCFDMMTTLPPPSYEHVMANLQKFALLPEDEPEEEYENIKVFKGINDTDVIVHSENVVLYTGIDETAYCLHYNKHNIRKCFPNGIRYGGLPRTIWLKDEMERDMCFMLMQWNMEKCDSDSEIIKESSEQKFTGLYGDVVLHSDSQIEFTSLSGQRVKCFYEPGEIDECFPQGISYGRLVKTIWFRDVEEREKCIGAMRKM